MAAQLTRFGWLAFGALIAANGACSDDAAPAMDAAPALPATHGCEPFETHSELLELAFVVAAGKTMSGLIYVVDATDSNVRAFVGTETALTRLHVAGESVSYAGEIVRNTLLIDEEPSSMLITEVNGAETRIARTLNVEQRDPAIDDLGPGEELTVIEPDTLDDAEVVDSTTEIKLEYLARLPNDELVLITRPEDEDGFDYESFRVFLGPEGQLAERPLIRVTRARDGGTTHVIFELDGGKADALFPVDLDGDQVVPGRATLDYDGETLPLTWLDPSADGALLQGARFECLE